MRFRLVASFAMAGFSAPRVASGAAATASLSVSRGDGAEACPDRPNLQAMVERILEHPLSGDDGSAGSTTTIEVAFRRRTDGYDADVRANGEKRGQRTLSDTSPTCDALGQGTAVTIALLLDERPVRQSATVPPPLAPPQASRFPVWAGVLAGVSLGQVGGPSFTPGVELGADLLPSWSLRAGGAFVLPHDNGLAPGSVAVSLLGAELAFCRVLWQLDVKVRAALCAAGSVASLEGRGQGYATATRASLPWVALGARAELEGVAADRFVWGLEGSLLAPLRKQTFSIEPSGIAYDSSPVGGVIRLRAGVRLW